MIEVRLERSPGYAEQLWRDLMATRMRWRPYAVPVGLALLFAGVAWSALRIEPPVGYALAGIGAANLLWHWWDKRRWFALARGAAGEDVCTLQFSPEGVWHDGPNASGELRWTAFDEVAPGEEGLFLVLAQGASIYVPYAAFGSRDDAYAVEAMFEASL